MNNKLVSLASIQELIELIKGTDNANLSNQNIVHGTSNTFIGNCNNNLAIGRNNVVEGNNSLVLGSNNIIQENSQGQIVLGKYNKGDANAAIVVGNGDGSLEEQRANSFVVTTDGNVVTNGNVTADGNVTAKEFYGENFYIGETPIQNLINTSKSESLSESKEYTDKKVQKILPTPPEEGAYDNSYILAANGTPIELRGADGISFETGKTDKLVISYVKKDEESFNNNNYQLKTLMILELRDNNNRLISNSLERILNIEYSDNLSDSNTKIELVHFTITNSQNLTSSQLELIDLNKSKISFFNSDSHWISIEQQLENSGVKDKILETAKATAQTLINNNNKTLPDEFIVNNFQKAAKVKEKALSAGLGYELYTAVNEILDKSFEFQEDYIDTKLATLYEEDLPSLKEEISEDIDTKIGELTYSFNIVSGDSEFTPGINEPKEIVLEDPRFFHISPIGTQELLFVVTPGTQLQIQLIGNSISDWQKIPDQTSTKWIKINQRGIFASNNKSSEGDLIIDASSIQEFLNILKTTTVIKIQDSNQQSNFCGATIYIDVQSAFIELNQLSLPLLEQDVNTNIDNKITEVNNNIDNKIENIVTAFGQSIGNIETRVNETNNEIGNVSDTVSNLEERIDGLNTSFSTQDLTVTGTINGDSNIVGGNNNSFGTSAIRNLIVGYKNTANKNNSIISGQTNIDNGGNGIICGVGNTTNATNSVINGQDCEITAGASSCIVNGNNSKAQAPYQVIVGTDCNGFNDKSSGKFQFIIGENLNAQADDAIVTQKLRIKKNGDISINDGNIYGSEASCIKRSVGSYQEAPKNNIVFGQESTGMNCYNNIVLGNSSSVALIKNCIALGDNNYITGRLGSDNENSKGLLIIGDGLEVPFVDASKNAIITQNLSITNDGDIVLSNGITLSGLIERIEKLEQAVIALGGKLD